MSKKMETVEINGVKYEVLIDEAKRIENFKVGDTVKLMKKEYSDTYKSYYGVILGFDDFVDMPNIQVAYIDIGYSEAKIYIIDINSASDEKYRISKVNDANLLIDKAEVIRMMNLEVTKKENEIAEIKRKINYFETRFEAYFKK